MSRAEGLGLGRQLRGGPLVLGALVVWNIANYAFFLLAGRMLGPADFGLAAALLAIPVIASVPCNALQYGVARASAHGDQAAASVYARAWSAAVLIALPTALVVIAAILALELADPSAPSAPIALTALTVLALPPLFLSLGRLQGAQRFLPYAATFAMWGVPRPVLFAALAVAGFGVSAAVGATLLAVALAAALGALLAPPGRYRATSGALAQWEPFRESLVPVMIGLSAVAVLINLDVVAAKLALDPEDAGLYGAAAVLGKAVVVIPQTLALVLLPQVAARSVRGQDTGPQLAVATLASVAAGLVGVLLCLWLSTPIMRIAFGEEFVDGADLLAPLVVGGTLLGITLVLVTHHAARQDYRFLYGAGVLAALYPLALWWLGTSGMRIALVGIVFGALALVLHEIIQRGRPDSIIASARALHSPPA